MTINKKNYQAQYIPKKFCREFVELKGDSQQLGMYMALVLGFKPLMDDCIHTSKLAEFKKICKKYKIYIRESIILYRVPQNRVPAYVIGRDNLTTTIGLGVSAASGKQGNIRLFLSKDKNKLKKAMWYPAIIKNRVIFPPLADQYSYGYVLGYPDCCIKFFKNYNNWNKYNYLYKAYQNTKGKASFLCNPFLKETGYSYIYHMPCSYSCKKTMQNVLQLRKAIKKYEPDYVKLTDDVLKNPCLVFFERAIYCFKGKIHKGFLEYSDFYFTSAVKDKDLFSQYFKKANRLQVENDKVNLYKGNKLVHVIDKGIDKSFLGKPFLLEFS